LVGGFVLGMPSRRTNNFPKSGRGLGHVTLQFSAVRSAILATAWLLVRSLLTSYMLTLQSVKTVNNAAFCKFRPTYLYTFATTVHVMRLANSISTRRDWRYQYQLRWKK